jgi:HSP20 family protein
VAVTRWSPLTELASLQSDMARMMDTVLGRTGTGNGGSTWMPPVDVTEADDELVLAFDLPGLAEDEITIELDDNVLTVSGSRERKYEHKGDNYYRWERRHGQFARSVALPSGVDEDKIKAVYEHGVLEIHVPKPEQAKPRTIEIGGSRSIEGKGTRKD